MTTRQLTFHPAAIAEAEEVSLWYSKRSELAATRFVEEFKLTCRKILKSPGRWPESSKGTRHVKLPCFPFSIVYRIVGTRVEVIAVAHGHRRPEYWKERL
jgi:plasmid stabilization system protein ParE